MPSLKTLKLMTNPTVETFRYLGGTYVHASLTAFALCTDTNPVEIYHNLDRIKVRHLNCAGATEQHCGRAAKLHNIPENALVLIGSVRRQSTRRVKPPPSEVFELAIYRPITEVTQVVRVRVSPPSSVESQKQFLVH